MADIEVVIKIDEGYFNNIKETVKDGDSWSPYLEIAKGVPLPKGHGRLGDLDVVDDNIYDLTRGMDLDYGQISVVLDNTPTIIEADKEEKE